MMRAVWRCITGFVTVIIFCPALLAQQARHDVLQISVEDELGGILVGARATLLEVATDQSRERATDEKGRVTFDGLAPGDYVLSVASPGFRIVERRLAIGTDRPRPLKLQLQVEVAERVD